MSRPGIKPLGAKSSPRVRWNRQTARGKRNNIQFAVKERETGCWLSGMFDVLADVCSRNRGFSDICISTKCRPNISPICDMVKTRVNQAANGQYKVTVPKGIADALELDGKRLKWEIKSGSKLEAKIVDE